MIDAATLLEVINEITMIHNQIGKGEMFLAGANMIILQNRIVNLYDDMVDKEKTKD